MEGKTRNFYAEGNTAKGFYSFYDSSIEGLKRLIILKGATPSVKSLLIKQIGEAFLHKGYDIELMHCVFDNDTLDGVIIPSIKTGIVGGTPGHTLDDKYSGHNITYIDLDLALDSTKIIHQKNKIKSLNQLITQNYQKAYDTFGEALKIHDEWEKIYLDNINFKELNHLTNELIELLLSYKSLKKESRTRDMFFGAATHMGSVDFIQNLTQDISKRYFIKGRPGTGKSTLLKKLSSEAEDRGFDVEIYHCGFDPNSLDMLIFPELSIAIFDSTAPHQYFPNRESDQIIDVYERAVVPGTDEKYDKELKNITERYSAKNKEAISYLLEAKTLQDELESYYSDAINYKKIEDIKNEILKMFYR